MTVGEKIRSLRTEQGLTQAQLGSKLGCSGAMIAQWEVGTRHPRHDTLKRIMTALGVDSPHICDDSAKITGRKIRNFRMSAGLTQGELGARLGASNTWVSKLECGNSSPTVDTLSKVATALNITVADLVSHRSPVPISRCDTLKALVDQGPLEIQYGMQTVVLRRTNKYNSGYNFEAGTYGQIIVHNV